MSDTVEGYKISLDAQLEKLEQILKDNPNDPSTLMAFGEMSFRRGRKLVALLAFQKVADMKPDVLEVHVALTKIYASQKMYSEAYGELAQALKLEKSSVEARVLYEILVLEAEPPPDLVPVFKNYLSTPYKPEEINLYVHQLEIEGDRLTNDVRELSLLLESSPMDTILEYNRNMAARRLTVVEDLLEKAKHLEPGKPEELASAAAAAAPAEAEEAKIEPEISEPGIKEEIPEERLETIPLAVEPEVSPVSPADKGRLLQNVREILDPMMQNFKKTRGVLGVFAFHLNGEIIHALQEDKLDFAEMIRNLEESLGSLWSFSSDLVYWVVEFQQGLMVFQTIAPKLFLCAIGDSSTSFGSLRYLMDKNRPVLSETLKGLDLTKLDR